MILHQNKILLFKLVSCAVVLASPELKKNYTKKNMGNFLFQLCLRYQSPQKRTCESVSDGGI